MKLSQLILFMGLSFALGIGVMTIFQSNKESKKPAITENTDKDGTQKESTKNNNSLTNLSSNLSNSPKTTKPKIVELDNELATTLLLGQVCHWRLKYSEARVLD